MSNLSLQHQQTESANLRFVHELSLRPDHFFDDYNEGINEIEMNELSGPALTLARRLFRSRALAVAFDHPLEVEKSVYPAKGPKDYAYKVVRELTRSHSSNTTTSPGPFTSKLLFNLIGEQTSPTEFYVTVFERSYPIEVRRDSLYRHFRQPGAHIGIYLNNAEFHQDAVLWLAIAWHHCEETQDYKSLNGLADILDKFKVVPMTPEELIVLEYPEIISLWPVITGLGCKFDEAIEMVNRAKMAAQRDTGSHSSTNLSRVVDL